MKRIPVRPLAAALAAGALAGLSGLLTWLAAGNLDTSATDASGDLQGTVYLAVAIPREETLDRELRERNQETLARFSRAFHDLHPGVSIQLVVFQEADLLAQMPRRQQAGLGPDLLMLSADAAMELQQQGQVRAIRPAADTVAQLEPQALDRLRLPDGMLAALPVLQQPELACFNRRRLPEGSPDRLEELLRLGSSGVRFGLSIEPVQLFWTVGSLGAGEALLAASNGRSLSALQRERLLQWLAWLQNASFQQHITFLGKQEELLNGLRQGRLDWISCRSSHIHRLQRHLGPDLGVAPLPGGAQGAATPINRLQVLAFGINSSPGQRRIAEELARFSVNPLVQRNLTLDSMEVLPVNRFVPAPVASSTILQSMVHSAREAEAAGPLLLALMENQGLRSALARVLAKVVFGDLAPREAVKALAGAPNPGPR